MVQSFWLPAVSSGSLEVEFAGDEIGDGGEFEVSIGDTVVYEKASEVEMADGLVLIPHKAILYVR